MKRLRNILIAIGILGVAAAQVAEPTTTAHLIVKVGDGGGYEDGDIIHALSETRILDTHAQHIAHPKNHPKKRSGHRQDTSILQQYLEATKEFKFERISNDTIRRTDLWNGGSETINNTPNADGEYMDVPLYIERRMKHDNHLIFGSAGTEFWYGGGTRKTAAIVDDVWDYIEANSQHNRNSYKSFPFSDREKSAFYAFKIDGYTEAEIRSMDDRLLSATGQVLKARKYKFDYRSFQSTTPQRLLDILDNSRMVEDTETKPKSSIQNLLHEKLSFLFGIEATHAAIVTKTIGTASRDYTTITLWEADLDDSGIYSASDDAVGEVYNDAAFDEAPTIDGGDTIGLASIKLTVPSGERHDGTAGNGARIVRTAAEGIRITEDNFTIEWLELDMNGNESNLGAIQDERSGTERNSQNVYKWLIVHDAFRSGANRGLTVNNGGAEILNNIVYDIDNDVGTAGDTEGIVASSTNANRIQEVYNNTVVNINNDNGSGNCYGLVMGDASTNLYKNNIVMDAGGTTTGTKQDYDIASPASADVDYNMASDTSAAGANSIDSAASSDQFVSTTNGSEDLHLKSGAGAIDEGLDLGTTPTDVQFDIDNRDRDTEGDTWDMGADEFVAAAPVPTGDKSFIFDPIDADGLGVSEIIKSESGRTSGSDIILFLPEWLRLFLIS